MDSRSHRRFAQPRSARVLIADDNPAFRDQLRTTIESLEGFTACGEAADAPAAVAAALELEPDVCLLDVRMPGYGIAAAWEITARMPNCRVLMVSISDDDADVFGALRAGAYGYVLKDASPAELHDSLVRALSGETPIDGRLVARMAETFRDPSARRRRLLHRVDGEPLTSREWEVLDLLKDELTTADIAGRLSLAPATVRTHVAGILHKLRAPDRETAVRLFVERDGLVDGQPLLAAVER